MSVFNAAQSLRHSRPLRHRRYFPRSPPTFMFSFHIQYTSTLTSNLLHIHRFQFFIDQNSPSRLNTQCRSWRARLISRCLFLVIPRAMFWLFVAAACAVCFTLFLKASIFPPTLFFFILPMFGALRRQVASSAPKLRLLR